MLNQDPTIFSLEFVMSPDSFTVEDVSNNVLVYYGTNDITSSAVFNYKISLKVMQEACKL